MGAGAQVIPAPVGGWNARDALEAMDPADAVQLDNWIPGNGVVVGRGGSRNQIPATHEITGGVFTLIPYEGNTSNLLMAAGNGNIYGVINDSGPLAAPVSLGAGFTNNYWQYGGFDTKTVMVNGADTGQVFNGVSLSNITLTQLATPVNTTFTTGVGTLATATYYYRVSAINANGETLASAETNLPVVGPVGINVKWGAVTGATGYKIYGRSTGAELLIATVGQVTTYLDDGSISPSGALPGANTTNVSSTLLIDVVNFKGRAVYVEKNSQRIWYAAAGSYQGMLTKLDFATVTQRGGYLMQAISWTRDSNDGVDDLFAFIFSTGEVLVYQGDDPSNVLAWSMIGRYYIGAPLSRRSHGRVASTEAVLTKDGFQTLDEAIANARLELVDSFGGKIFRAAKIAAQRWGANTGWQAIFYPRGNLFIANVPVSDTTQVQYVRNTNTGMWCRFLGWPGTCFVVWKDRLYFGTKGGQAVLADTQYTDGYLKAYSDNDAAIEYTALTAYQKFGQPGLKSQISSAKVTANVFDGKAISLNAFADYRARDLPASPTPNEQVQAMWDVSPWDRDYWASPANDPSDSTPRVFWRPIQIRTGFATAISMRYKSVVQNVYWYSTEFIFNQAGVN